MNFITQIKCTAAALALFAALGLVALTRAETAATDGLHPRVEVGAPIPVDAETVKVARVHVGAPIEVDANPTAEDIERASR